jgi:glycerol-3-phosphate dehydrogenase
MRALVSSGKRASNVSRAHRVIDHERTDGLNGLVSVLGGKMTGYRGIAEEVTDLVGRKLDLRMGCTTADTPLPGAVPSQHEDEDAGARLDAATLGYLDALYGSRRGEVLDVVRQDARDGRPLCPHTHDIVAEVWHAVKAESAMTVSDFLLRRSLLGLAPCQGLDAVDAVAAEMGALLGWDAATRLRQADEYRARAALGRQYLGGNKAA